MTPTLTVTMIPANMHAASFTWDCVELRVQDDYLFIQPPKNADLIAVKREPRTTLVVSVKEQL